jgi:hypothetical protein
VRDDGRRATNESAAAPAYLAFARTPSFLTWTSFPQNSFARRAARRARGAALCRNTVQKLRVVYRQY